MTAPHPNHETALMLLRAAGFDGEDIENVIGCEGSTWRAPILLLPHELDAMAAAVDAREKAMRDLLERIDGPSIADGMKAMAEARALLARIKKG